MNTVTQVRILEMKYTEGNCNRIQRRLNSQKHDSSDLITRPSKVSQSPQA